MLVTNFLFEIKKEIYINVFDIDLLLKRMFMIK